MGADVALIAKVTLVLVTALLVARLAGRQPASVRSWILTCAFGLLLLLPFATIALPGLTVEIPAGYSARLASAASTQEAPAAPAVPVPAGPEASAAAGRVGLPSVRTGLRLLWVAGVVVFASPLAVGLWRLRRLRTHGRAWTHTSVPASVEMVLHDGISVPTTYGVLRPVIALPTDAPAWPEQDLRRVLLHELEHVSRRDWLVHIAARAICALYWFHPLAWIAWRQLCLEAERACDDAVLREEDGVAYAAQLVSLARRLTKGDALPSLSVVGRSRLSTRVGAVLSGDVARGPVRRAVVVAVAGLAVAAMLAIAPLQGVAARQIGQLPGRALAFESASVRRAASLKAEFCCVVNYQDGGRVSVSRAGLLDLIVSAYQINPWQLVGEPSWADGNWTDDGALFDLQAIAARDASEDEMRLMLQTLLADRFQLKVHRETRRQQVYDLVVEPGGHKLQPAGDRPYVPVRDVWLRVDASNMMATARIDQVTMPQLARHLEIVGTRVSDRTGLTGTYRFTARWDAYPDSIREKYAVTPDPERPTIFEALPAQLGLRLKEATGAVEYLVVDSVTRPRLDR